MATDNTVMEASKRRVACEACHALKARCEASLTASVMTCERCWRLGKKCIPIRRRRPRERIAELEAQVAKLAHLSSVQIKFNNATPSSLIDGYTKPQHDTSEIELIRDCASSQLFREIHPLAVLDRLTSMHEQKQAIGFYQDQIGPIFPMVILHSPDIAQLRTKFPILLSTIVTFASASLFPENIQQSLIQGVMQVLAYNVIGIGKRTLELAQALLVASFWYRSNPDSKHATVYQFIQESIMLATDIGIGGPQSIKSPGARFEHGHEQTNLIARRTWLACFVATASYSVVMRRRDANVWTEYHEECICYLSRQSPYRTDRLLCFIAEGENLCLSIANDLGFCEPSSSTTFYENCFRDKRSKLRRVIDLWAGQISSHVERRAVKFYQQIALLYVNEPVLHTTTNKTTFSVPFADQIAATDFAAPVVTDDHTVALHELKDACHSLLNIALETEPSTILALSSLSHVPRILYAVFILVKMYVALTGPGNTYGEVMNPSELRLPEVFQSLKPLAGSLLDLDPVSFNTRIINAYQYLETWFRQYNELTEQYKAVKAQELAQSNVQSRFKQ